MAEKEYIERSAILDILADPHRKASDEIEVAILKCWDRIKKIPAADVVEVRHSCWVYDGYGEFHCHDCKMIWHISEGAIDDLRYCPNCGAKMDGGVNDG